MVCCPFKLNNASFQPTFLYLGTKAPFCRITTKTDEFTHIWLVFFLVFGRSAFNQKKKKHLIRIFCLLGSLVECFPSPVHAPLVWGLGWLCRSHVSVSCRSGALFQAVVHSDITSSSMSLMDFLLLSEAFWLLNHFNNFSWALLLLSLPHTLVSLAQC